MCIRDRYATTTQLYLPGQNAVRLYTVCYILVLVLYCCHSAYQVLSFNSICMHPPNHAYMQANKSTIDILGNMAINIPSGPSTCTASMHSNTTDESFFYLLIHCAQTTENTYTKSPSTSTSKMAQFYLQL